MTSRSSHPVFVAGIWGMLVGFAAALSLTSVHWVLLRPEDPPFVTAWQLVEVTVGCVGGSILLSLLCSEVIRPALAGFLVLFCIYRVLSCGLAVVNESSWSIQRCACLTVEIAAIGAAITLFASSRSRIQQATIAMVFHVLWSSFDLIPWSFSYHSVQAFYLGEAQKAHAAATWFLLGLFPGPLVGLAAIPISTQRPRSSALVKAVSDATAETGSPTCEAPRRGAPELTHGDPEVPSR